MRPSCRFHADSTPRVRTRVGEFTTINSSHRASARFLWNLKPEFVDTWNLSEACCWNWIVTEPWSLTPKGMMLQYSHRLIAHEEDQHGYSLCCVDGMWKHLDKVLTLESRLLEVDVTLTMPARYLQHIPLGLHWGHGKISTVNTCRWVIFGVKHSIWCEFGSLIRFDQVVDTYPV